MTDEAFLVLTGNVAFVIPINPGPFADHPAGATVAQITEVNKQHAIARYSFQLYNTVQAALRNQLIAAVPDTYIRKLRNDDKGYGAVTILQFLTHLFLHYGKIDASELSENLTRMNLPWNPPTPIETLHTQLTEGATFAAAAGEVIPATWIVRSGYDNIHKTGLFEVACREWRAKPEANKTYDEFQEHFTVANMDRLQTSTTGLAGYSGAANNITWAQPELPDSKYEALERKLDFVLAAFAKQGTATPVAAKPQTTTALSYCWTHGHSKKLAHTSLTCKTRAKGHQETATATNTMRGSTRVWGKK